jgi:L-fuconolactonase
MLDFPIVDSHVHLLMNKGLPYKSLQGTYTLADYNKACGSIEVDTIVFMECDCELTHYKQEGAFASGIAHVDDRIKAIVSALPVEKGAVLEKELEALIQNPLIKGVRRLLKFEDNDFCVQKDFIEGVRLLGKYNLSFDICTTLEQNQNVVELVSRCPDVSFIVDHIGTPDIVGGRYELWKSGIGQLASFPNVFCKLSSIATEADKANWKESDIRPYIDYLLSVFGTDRLAFGGDWPVSLVSAKFEESVTLLESLISKLSSTEKMKIFRENALKFYSIS